MCKSKEWARIGCRDEQVLGKGAFGVVYEARSLDNQKDYACKSISKAKLVTKVSTMSSYACLAIDLLYFVTWPDCCSLSLPITCKQDISAAYSLRDWPCCVTGGCGRHTERGRGSQPYF